MASMILCFDFPFPFEVPWLIQRPNPTIGLGNFAQGRHATRGCLEDLRLILFGTPGILGLDPL